MWVPAGLHAHSGLWLSPRLECDEHVPNSDQSSLPKQACRVFPRPHLPQLHHQRLVGPALPPAQQPRARGCQGLMH